MLSPAGEEEFTAPKSELQLPEQVSLFPPVE